MTALPCRLAWRDKSSLMIAAGLNIKALSVYMGHASVVISVDRYRHLMPGNETQAAAILDASLARAVTPGDVPVSLPGAQQNYPRPSESRS